VPHPAVTGALERPKGKSTSALVEPIFRRNTRDAPGWKTTIDRSGGALQLKIRAKPNR